MSKNLRKCMKTMHIYCCTESKVLKKSLLCEMSKHQCFFDAIFEIVNNIYLKNLSLKSMTIFQKREAKRFASIMNKIHKCPKKKLIRRKLVKQTGGFIQFILPILASVVSSLIQNASSQKGDVSSS